MIDWSSATAILLRRIGMRIDQPAQVRRSRTRIQFAEKPIVPRLRFQASDAALWIADVAEYDRIGGTCGLARRHNFAVTNAASLFLRGNAGVIDTLNAVGTLF